MVVVMAADASASDVEHVVSVVRDAGGEAFGMYCDVSDPRSVEALVAGAHLRALNHASISDGLISSATRSPKSFKMIFILIRKLFTSFRPCSIYQSIAS